MKQSHWNRIALSGCILLGLLGAGCSQKPEQQEQQKREQKQVDWDEMVRHLASNDPGLSPIVPFWPTEERGEGTKTTVKAKLQELGAFLDGGKVYDADCRELYFYFVQLPPESPRHPPTQDTEKEIAELKKKYHVIRMYGPTGKD